MRGRDDSAMQTAYNRDNVKLSFVTSANALTVKATCAAFLSRLRGNNANDLFFDVGQTRYFHQLPFALKQKSLDTRRCRSDIIVRNGRLWFSPSEYIFSSFFAEELS